VRFGTAFGLLDSARTDLREVGGEVVLLDGMNGGVLELDRSGVFGGPLRDFTLDQWDGDGMPELGDRVEGGA
jgi:hypothetical protein